MTEYYKTSDGTPFFKEETAKTHARTLKDEKVETVEKPKKTEESDKPETVKQILETLEKMDLETVQKFLDVENEKEAPRKTVVEALQKRITELENPA